MKRDQKEATSPALDPKKCSVKSNVLLNKPMENLIDFWCDKSPVDNTEVMEADKRNSSRGEEENSVVPGNTNLAGKRTRKTSHQDAERQN